MANLDTRSKRASGAQILSPWILALVLPDGAIGTRDRPHIAWVYSGISSVSAAPTSRIYSISAEARALAIDSETRALVVGQETRTLAVR